MCYENHATLLFLKNLVQHHKLITLPVLKSNLKGYRHIKKVRVLFLNRVLFFYVDDEYDDLTEKNILLNNYLLLRELQHFIASKDYLDWCSMKEINANLTEARTYYMNLEHHISPILKKISPFKVHIDEMELQLNSGIIQYLRKL